MKLASGGHLDGRRWIECGAYTRMLGGDHPRRADDADAKGSEAAREAAGSDADVFRQTGAPGT